MTFVFLGLIKLLVLLLDYRPFAVDVACVFFWRSVCVCAVEIKAPPSLVCVMVAAGRTSGFVFVQEEK